MNIYRLVGTLPTKWRRRHLTHKPDANAEIAICLWFDGEAEEAVAHYLDVFQGGRITKTFRPRPEAPGRAGVL